MTYALPAFNEDFMLREEEEEEEEAPAAAFILSRRRRPMKTSQRSFASQKAQRYKDKGGLAWLRIETQMSAH